MLCILQLAPARASRRGETYKYLSFTIANARTRALHLFKNIDIAQYVNWLSYIIAGNVRDAPRTAEAALSLNLFCAVWQRDGVLSRDL